MTIYKDGKEQEKIVMHDLETKADMHAMMKEKGFVLKTGGETTATTTDAAATARDTKEGLATSKRIDTLLKERKAVALTSKEKRLRAKEEQQILGKPDLPSYWSSIHMFMAFACTLIFVLVGMRRRGNRKRAT
jgi:hypothetical protein